MARQYPKKLRDTSIKTNSVRTRRTSIKFKTRTLVSQFPDGVGISKPNLVIAVVLARSTAHITAGAVHGGGFAFTVSGKDSYLVWPGANRTCGPSDLILFDHKVGCKQNTKR